MIDKFQAATEHAERLSNERGALVTLRLIRGGIEIEASRSSRRGAKVVSYYEIGQSRDALIQAMNHLVARLDAESSAPSR